MYMDSLISALRRIYHDDDTTLDLLAMLEGSIRQQINYFEDALDELNNERSDLYSRDRAHQEHIESLERALRIYTNMPPIGVLYEQLTNTADIYKRAVLEAHNSVWPLKDTGRKKIDYIKNVRRADASMGLKEAKEFVEFFLDMEANNPRKFWVIMDYIADDEDE